MVVKAVGGGYCRLQTPLKPALAARGTVAGHWLGALEGGGGTPRPSNASLPSPSSHNKTYAERSCVGGRRPAEPARAAGVWQIGGRQVLELSSPANSVYGNASIAMSSQKSSTTRISNRTNAWRHSVGVTVPCRLLAWVERARAQQDAGTLTYLLTRVRIHAPHKRTNSSTHTHTQTNEEVNRQRHTFTRVRAGAVC